MRFHVMTLFPEMFDVMHTSVIGRAMERGLIALRTYQIRDFSDDAKHHKVDDYTYGGGAGMLMRAQPVYDCYRHVVEGIQGCEPPASAGGRSANDISAKLRTVYLTPQGIPFTQEMARGLARAEDVVLLCGHYEGVDERVLEEIEAERISIGDYVLSGGELPAMVLIDAVARLVPGVLSNEESAQTESFDDGLLEYPQYTRPEVWRDRRVPEILLSGDHAKVDAWRKEQAVARTREMRPDLLAGCVPPMANAEGCEPPASALDVSSSLYCAGHSAEPVVSAPWHTSREEEIMQSPGAADKRERLSATELDDTSRYFHVGAVAGTHALKGEMRVFPTTDDPERFTEGLVLYARKANAKASDRKKDGGGADALRTLTVESARVHGKFVLVKCKEVNSVEDAEALKGTELYVSREDAIPLEEGEYFVVDLIGLSMRDEEGKELGTLKDVISAPANDVYVMEHKETGKEILLPAIKQCILNVDMEQRVMTVHLLDGLLDVY